FIINSIMIYLYFAVFCFFKTFYYNDIIIYCNRFGYNFIKPLIFVARHSLLKMMPLYNTLIGASVKMSHMINCICLQCNIRMPFVLATVMFYGCHTHTMRF